MKINKKSIANLPVCYCVAPLIYKGQQHFLVGSEQDHPCLLFDREGNRVAQVWDTPGGTMSMVQVPGRDGVFLAIRRFYSPDRGLDASIYLVWEEGGVWRNRVVAQVPCLHRMDILSRDGAHWVIACCLKSGYEYEGDWRFPGKTYVCRLPEGFCGEEDTATCGEAGKDESAATCEKVAGSESAASIDGNVELPERLLGESGMLPEFTPLLDQMLENHGYSRDVQDGVMSGIVGCKGGTYRFTPPAEGSEWSVEQLCADPASDGLLIDLDGCGEKELVTISPFHGDTITVYKRSGGKYEKVWEYEKKVPLAHAITCGVICGRPTVVIGHRIDDRDLFLITYEDGYRVRVADHDVGPTNAMYLRIDGRDVVIAANREINEVAYYTFEED